MGLHQARSDPHAFLLRSSPPHFRVSSPALERSSLLELLATASDRLSRRVRVRVSAYDPERQHRFRQRSARPLDAVRQPFSGIHPLLAPKPPPALPTHPSCLAALTARVPRSLRLVRMTRAADWSDAASTPARPESGRPRCCAPYRTATHISRSEQSNRSTTRKS